MGAFQPQSEKVVAFNKSRTYRPLLPPLESSIDYSLSIYALQRKSERAFSLCRGHAIIPLALVGYEMIIANSTLRRSLAIYYSGDHIQLALEE